MKLFVDTGALAAAGVPADPLHRRATDFLRGLPPGFHLATSNLVFAETMTLLAARHGQSAAVRFGEAFFCSRLFSEVYYSDEALERAAVVVMRRFHDKRLSFVDAASIALVKSEGLDGVFGFDEDFRRCGIVLFPR